MKVDAKDEKVRNSNFLAASGTLPHNAHRENTFFRELSNTRLLQIRPHD